MSMLSGSTKAEGLWDAKPPRKLQDSGLGPSCTGLPESRLDSKLTPVSCAMARHMLSLTFNWLIGAIVSRGLISPSEKQCAEALVATAVLSTFLYSFGTWLTTTGETDDIDMPDIEGILRTFEDTSMRWSEWSPEARRAKDLLDQVFQKLDESMETAPMRELSLVLNGMGLNFGCDTVYSCSDIDIGDV